MYADMWRKINIDHGLYSAVTIDTGYKTFNHLHDEKVGVKTLTVTRPITQTGRERGGKVVTCEIG